MANAQLVAEAHDMQALAEQAFDKFDDPKPALKWLRTMIRQELRLGSGYYAYARACFWDRVRLAETGASAYA